VLLEALGLQGDDSTVLILPALGSGSDGPPGRRHEDRCAVDGVATGALGRAASAVVTLDGTLAPAAAIVVPVRALRAERLEGVDPAFGLHRIVGDITLDDSALTSVDWNTGLAAGRRAISHELVGVSRTMLELARTHALHREQFGRTISGFQAIRHRLAETWVAIESAAALADGAWDDPADLWLSSLAKSMAGRQARVAARHCQQVLAGIGFTTEHPFHLSLRRALLLDSLLGSSGAIERQLGEELLATRRLPPPLALAAH
jgi:hypothetical protein